MEGGGARGHSGAELARLEAPQQLLVGATQPLLLVALLLHVHLQVGVLLRELPGNCDVLVYSFLEVLVLLLQHLQSLLQVHILFSYFLKLCDF